MTNVKKNGAGILYLVVTDNPSERYGIIGKSRHKHEWEIPGGKQDPTDPTMIFAAARESVEEVGLHPRFHKKLVKFITDNNYNVTLYYPNGKYVLYIVKIKQFDFEKANKAAAGRLKVFEKLDSISQNELHTLVELVEYKKINMWEEIGNRDKKYRDLSIRQRDIQLLRRDDLIDKVYYVSRTEAIPVFDESFEFIDFKEIEL